jgi:hypothetical protein
LMLFFLLLFLCVILQDCHLSFLIAGLTSILPGFFLMTRLENLVLPDCRVNLKTPYDDKVDLLISLRFS